MRPLLSGCGALCLFAAGGSLLAYLATAALAITGSPDALSFAVLSGAGALLLAGAGTVLLHAGLSDAAGGAATFGARAERSAARMPLVRVRPMTWLLAFGFVLLAGQATLSVAPQVAGFVLPPLHFAAALLPALAMTSRIAKQPRFYALAFGGCGAATVSLVLEALVAGVVGALLFAGLNTTEEGRQAIESVRLGLAGAADAGGAGGTVDPTALDIEWLLPLLTRPMVIVGIFGLVGVIGPLIEEAVKSSYVAVRRPVSVGTAWWWGIAAGAGFGVTEATALGAMGVGAWATAMIVRSSATLMHATMTGVAAVGWHRALVERNRRGGAALLVVAAVGHMAWNALVLLAALAGLDVGSGSEGWSGVAVLASGGGIGVLLVAVLLLYAAGSARFGRRGTWYTPGSTSDGGRPMTADERARAPIDKARSEQTDATGRLLKFLRIPSVSAVPERAPDMQRAAQWVADRLTSAGATDVRIDATPGHPVVYARAAGPPGAPTVLVYGHYDVQPTDPDELWDSPPFEPTIRDGNVYARGASDDKGQVLIHLEALSAFTSTEGRPPVTLKYVIEGEEEIGSPNLEPWLEDHAQELAADVAVISDTAMLAPGQPSIVYGLRGLAYIEVEFTGPQRDLHSGQFGGAVRNPAHALARVIGQLHDSEGRITVPHFYDRVQPLGREERELLSRVPFDQASYEQTAGVAGGWGEAGYSVVERLGARPTLDVNGMWSGWTGPGAKTVLPAKASAKISMRLVPDQDPEEIADLCGEHIRHLAGPGVTVEIQRLHSARPAVVDRDLPAIRAAVEGYEAAFGKAPVFSREGGSIPVVASLEEVLGLSTVLMGFGLPDDNLHAPNEKFHLDNFHRGMEAVIVLLQALGQEAA